MAADVEPSPGDTPPQVVPPPPIPSAPWEHTAPLPLTSAGPGDDQGDPGQQDRRRTVVLVAAACALLAVVAVAGIVLLTGGDDDGDLALDPLPTLVPEPDEDQVETSDTAVTAPPISVETVPPVGTTGTDTTLATVVVPVPETTTTVAAAPTVPASTDAPLATAIPETTAPPVPTTTPGDLALPGIPMSRPPCDGGYITVVGNAIDPAQYAQAISDLLARYPESMYLRTDQTCPSLRADVDGNAIYTVFYGPFADSQTACAQRVLGPDDAYVRRLSLTDPPTHVIDCD